MEKAYTLLCNESNRKFIKKNTILTSLNFCSNFLKSRHLFNRTK